MARKIKRRLLLLWTRILAICITLLGSFICLKVAVGGSEQGAEVASTATANVPDSRLPAATQKTTAKKVVVEKDPGRSEVKQVYGNIALLGEKTNNKKSVYQDVAEKPIENYLAKARPEKKTVEQKPATEKAPSPKEVAAAYVPADGGTVKQKNGLSALKQAINNQEKTQKSQLGVEAAAGGSLDNRQNRTPSDN